MATLDAAAVAALLVELGRRTALGGDNYFRAKAYQRAADQLSALVEPLDRVIAENRLRELPGVGETIADRYQAAPHRHTPAARKAAPGRPQRRARHAVHSRSQAGEDQHSP